MPLAEREIRPRSLPPLLILGDDCEVDVAGPHVMGNAAAIECDLGEGRLAVTTSIPGLPAVYLADTAAAFVVTSDLSLLNCVEGISLRFDSAGVTDLALIGRPVEHRTLFAGVQIVPGGRRLVLRPGDGPSVEIAWLPPRYQPCETWDEYTDLQAEAFERSIASLDLDSSALWLSSGLDSRATLAGLIARGASVLALTASGETHSLDARTASRLCSAYGMEHRTVVLDAAFHRSLPELVSDVSLLSGGVASVWHAPQLYCYRVLGKSLPIGALSGYLGNQIGRRGTEGLTPRNARVTLLDGELVEERANAAAWYSHAMQPDGFLETQFLIQQESTFGNLASYAIGNAHSVQQSAYACRPMIENMWRMPKSSASAWGGSHVQTLRHLFLGGPREESFQRRYINRVGGLVASYPVNWGCRSRGGVSLKGVSWGSLALLDAIVSSRYADTPAARLTKAVGVAGLHEFRSVHHWMLRYMKDFVYDEVLSRNAKQAGLFDSTALERLLGNFYSGQRGCLKEVLLALELALASHHFRATA